MIACLPRGGSRPALQPLESLLQCARDGARALANEHIDLRADAERRRIHAGLDREAGARNQAPLVVRFEVVHMDAIAVDLGPETVPCAMDELRAEAALLAYRPAAPAHSHPPHHPPPPPPAPPH